jgi:hypothetical protein
MKINFDKYDASCENGVWTWHIKNADNTKTIAVKVTFKENKQHDYYTEQYEAMFVATAEVDKVYFEEIKNKTLKRPTPKPLTRGKGLKKEVNNNDTLVEELYSLKPVVVSLDDENIQDTNAKIDELIEKYERK